MAKNQTPAKDAGILFATEVASVFKMPGITFRPGVVYQASAAVREKLDAAGVLKKAPGNRD